MFGLLIWWYLVAYEPSNPWNGGSPIGEFTALEGCEEQRQIYLMRHYRGFARCEGSKQRQHVPPRMELENQKLKAEIENQLLEAEIRRRILKGELAPEARPR